MAEFFEQDKYNIFCKYIYNNKINIYIIFNLM